MILYLGNKLSIHGFNPTSVETLGGKFSELGYTVIAKSSVKSKIFRLADMLWAVVKYKKNKPVIFIDTYSSSAFWFAVAIGRLAQYCNVSYIPILRGGNLPQRLDRSPRISKVLFSNSYMNIATSGYLHTEFSKRNIQVETIPNNIEIINYPFKLRSNISPKLLWVRAFDKIYNPHMALEVLNELKKDYPEATLCMVGPDKDGTMEQCKQLAAELKLDVSFTGKLKKDDWIKLSAEYNIFINTTDVDNTPVSVMEAMALGMPVVTTNAGGIPFLFKNMEQGIIVNRGDVSAMTNAILVLIDQNGKASQISTSARAKAENWDWNVVKHDWINLIDKAMKKNHE